jgi:hypothetical protein
MRDRNLCSVRFLRKTGAIPRSVAGRGSTRSTADWPTVMQRRGVRRPASRFVNRHCGPRGWGFPVRRRSICQPSGERQTEGGRPAAVSRLPRAASGFIAKPARCTPFHPLRTAKRGHSRLLTVRALTSKTPTTSIDENGEPSPCQGEGRGFESRRPLQRKRRSSRFSTDGRRPADCAHPVCTPSAPIVSGRNGGGSYLAGRLAEPPLPERQSPGG